MFTSISPNPRFARCAVSVARDSAAVMSGTSRRSSLATALWGRMVFPPGPVYADQALDVDRGARHQQLQRLRPAHVAHPVLHAEQPLRGVLVETTRRFRDHRLLIR